MRTRRDELHRISKLLRESRPLSLPTQALIAKVARDALADLVRLPKRESSAKA